MFSVPVENPVVWPVDITSVLTVGSVCITSWSLYFCITISVLFRNHGLQHSKNIFQSENAQKTQKKALSAIISVDKNKPKTERLFGAVYLKMVCSISSNSILKRLLFDINSEKSALFIGNSLKMLILFNMNSEKVFIYCFICQ